MPELFPKNFAKGYQLKDDRRSAKQDVPIRRIALNDGVAYSVRPSFLMPYMTARTEHVQGPLFLRKFGVPFWALARVFGGNPMYWYRIECGFGRLSVVGTTVRQAELPAHLLADEHHQTRDGQKVYIATTVGDGCCLGVETAETAGTDDLKAAYETFKDEARDIRAEYTPKTVGTDGWKGTQAAWKALFPEVVILLCFLHGWLKIRDRAKHLKELFADVSRRVWEAYHAPDRRSFGQRLRWLRHWAMEHLGGIVRENVLDLCRKRDRFSIAFGHPEGHRTSNMLDRLMRGMNRYFDRGQHLHGSREACRLHCRAWALLSNFTPSPGNDAKEQQVALSCRTSQPTPLPRGLAPEPIDLRITWRIPMSTPPKSVTVSKMTMEMAVLKCKTVDGVLKELAVFALVYNLVRPVMCESAKVQGVAPERVSLLDALRWLVGAEDLSVLLVNPARDGRVEPRVVKRRPKQYPRMAKPRSVLRKELLTKKVAA